jgi:hypothetical protein
MDLKVDALVLDANAFGKKGILSIERLRERLAPPAPRTPDPTNSRSQETTKCQRSVGTVNHHPEPLSQISRSRCQTSPGAASTIRWSRNVQHHPEHDIPKWAARDSNPARRIKSPELFQMS